MREERLRRAEEVRLGVAAVDGERRKPWFEALADNPELANLEYQEHRRAVLHRDATARAKTNPFGLG